MKRYSGTIIWTKADGVEAQAKVARAIVREDTFAFDVPYEGQKYNFVLSKPADGQFSWAGSDQLQRVSVRLDDDGEEEERQLFGRWIEARDDWAVLIHLVELP